MWSCRRPTQRYRRRWSSLRTSCQAVHMLVTLQAKRREIGTYLESHWGLRVVLATESEGVGIGQSSNDAAVNEPLDAILVPVDGVSVESALSVGDIVVLRSVVGGGVALAELL